VTHSPCCPGHAESMTSFAWVECPQGPTNLKAKATPTEVAVPCCAYACALREYIVLILILASVGIVGIVSGVVAWRFLRSLEATKSGRKLATLRLAALIIGIAAAGVSWPLTGRMSYSYAGTNGNAGRVAGIPFMAAYFDAHGFDYVGPLTMPAVLGNALFWFMVPQLALAGYAVARKWTRDVPQNASRSRVERPAGTKAGTRAKHRRGPRPP
jgi:hypothetical protein